MHSGTYNSDGRDLLINAVDAMPDGGTPRIEAVGTGDAVALRVRDTGKGTGPSLGDAGR